MRARCVQCIKLYMRVITLHRCSCGEKRALVLANHALAELASPHQLPPPHARHTDSCLPRVHQALGLRIRVGINTPRNLDGDLGTRLGQCAPCRRLRYRIEVYLHTMAVIGQTPAAVIIQ